MPSKARWPPPHADAPAAHHEARHATSASLSHTVALSLDLQRALAQLSDAERQAIVLCHGAELSHAEAAQVLGWPLGTVKTHVLRGKEKLRASLAAWAPAPPPPQGNT
jgi:RNA polymerase sigma factor (sigma-70 family)